MKKVKEMSLPLKIFLYFLAFLLLLEWLQPVLMLTNSGYALYFGCFILLSFLLTLLNLHWSITSILKLVFIYWILTLIYIEGAAFSIQTFMDIISVLSIDIGLLVSQQWDAVSDLFRTTLFLLMLWMLTYLVHYWIEVKQRMLLFYLTTVIFIAFIDTFTEYEVGYSIYTILVVGFLLLGSLTVKRITNVHRVSISAKEVVAFAVPFIALLVMSVGIASFLPKFAPVWPDPVPYIKNVVTGEEGSGTSGVSKSGYDPDDTQLGGPFVEDDTLVFQAAIDQKQYWKVETKNTYTSKGWVQEGFSSQIQSRFNQSFLQGFEDDEDNPIQQARIRMAEKHPFLVYPYGVLDLKTDEYAMLVFNEDIDQYEASLNGVPLPLTTYTTVFQEPSYSLTQLRETGMESYENLRGLDSYLQLPDTVPERVHDLALSITRDESSVYEKAKAIERYFGRNGFSYERTNVAVPSEDEDYVDQFLFDTKQGYCDNFSSSMVVMLRSVGIPAKWVKGFAPGEASTNQMNERIYEVTNNEAHSWVEVFIPEIGWMPFEPTLGFSGVASIDYDLELEIDDPEVPEMPEEEREKLEQKLEQEKKEEPEEKEQPAEKKKVAVSFGKFGWVFFIFVIASVLLLYVRRKKWLPKWILFRYRKKDRNWTQYEKQYMILLSLLKLYGLERKPSETLSQYAMKVDEQFSTTKMRELTTFYEKGLYGKIEENSEWQRLQQLWEEMVIMISN